MPSLITSPQNFLGLPLPFMNHPQPNFHTSALKPPCISSSHAQTISTSLPASCPPLNSLSRLPSSLIISLLKVLKIVTRIGKGLNMPSYVEKNCNIVSIKRHSVKVQIHISIKNLSIISNIILEPLLYNIASNLGEKLSLFFLSG